MRLEEPLPICIDRPDGVNERPIEMAILVENLSRCVAIAQPLPP